MKKLLNTLYVTSENGYLGLEGETVVVYQDSQEIGRLPLHNLDGIVVFGYKGQVRHLWAHVQIGIFHYVM